MSEKKKGFWSWLGFGKKAEQAVGSEQENTIEIAETSEQQQKAHTGSHTELASAKAETPDNMPVDTTLEDPEKNEIEAIDISVEIKPEVTQFNQAQEVSETNTDNDDGSNPEEIEEKISVSQSSTEIAPLATIEDGAVEVEAEERAKESAEKSTEVEPQVVKDEAPLEESKEIKSEQAVTSPENNTQNSLNEPSEHLETMEIVTTEMQEPSEIQTSKTHYQEKPSRGGFFSRLIQGLVKTKQNIGSGFLSLFRGKKIDDDLFEELEEQLLIADLGMPTTTKIIKNLTQHASRAELRDAEQLYQKLKEELAAVLTLVSQPLIIEPKKPYVILMVGVNGVGKTTTIGKLARKFQAEGKSVMLAAGDTFRAAAVEQLQVWGERNHIPVVAQASGADSASVIFDAMQSAAAKGIDVLIADTAGRLQNKNHLMDELKKIVRVMKKYDESAPHEIMLTLDAGTGQNAISQAKLFHEAVGLTGITLTKLDGTAKGGVIFAIADQFRLPIRYIGVGEKIEDLREFDATEFIEALFTQEEK